MYIYTNHHDSTDLFCWSLLASFRIARFLGLKTTWTIFRSHCLRLRQDPWAKRASTTYLGNSHNYAEAPPGSYNNASRRTPTDQNGLICGNGKLLYVAVIAHIFNSAGHEQNNLAKRPLCVGQLQVNDCLEDDLARLEIRVTLQEGYLEVFTYVSVHRMSTHLGNHPSCGSETSW